MKKLLNLSVIGLLTLSFASFSEVPVINGTSFEQSNNSYSYARENQPRLTVDQQLAKLQQQVSFLQSLNLPAKIDDLQQKTASLQGKVESLEHDLKQMQDQQKSMYTDLDNRLSTKKSISTNKTFPQDSEEKNDDSENSANTESNKINSAASTLTDSERVSYQHACDLIKKKQYSKSISSFKLFVKTYPNSSYSGNAHYFLGKLYTITGNTSQSKQEFTLVANKLAEKSEKTPSALFELGQIAFKENKQALAKQYWQKLIKQYPNSKDAKAAKIKIKSIKQYSKKQPQAVEDNTEE